MSDLATNQNGNYELQLTVKIEVNPAVVGIDVSNYDLVDLLVSRIRALDIVEHAE